MADLTELDQWGIWVEVLPGEGNAAGTLMDQAFYYVLYTRGMMSAQCSCIHHEGIAMANDFTFFSKDDMKKLMHRIHLKLNLMMEAKVKAFCSWYLENKRAEGEDTVINLLSFTDVEMRAQQRKEQSNEIVFDGKSTSKEMVKVPSDFSGKQ